MIGSNCPCEEVPVYDVSGIYFVQGVTDFYAANVYYALRMAGISKRFGLKVKVPVQVYDNLDVSNQLDHLADDTIRWRQFILTIDEQSDTSKSVVDSLITSPCGKQVILRTREC